MSDRQILLIALCLAVASVSDRAAADTVSPAADASEISVQKPLWELGVGAVAAAIADYPASDHYRVEALPVPYFIYRGDIFKSDAAGTRLYANSGNVEWELSGGGTLSSNSNSDARTGMPHLDYLLEAGPKAKITLARPTGTSRILLDLPVRAAVSTNFSSRWQGRGALFAPDLTFEDKALFGGQWKGHLTLGVTAASRQLQEFYYSVAPEYERAGRPAYEARAGFLGSQLSVVAFRALTPHFSVFFATDLNSYKGAANSESPLFRTTGGIGAGVGFAWSFIESKARADSND